MPVNGFRRSYIFNANKKLTYNKISALPQFVLFFQQDTCMLSQIPHSLNCLGSLERKEMMCALNEIFDGVNFIEKSSIFLGFLEFFCRNFSLVFSAIFSFFSLEFFPRAFFSRFFCRNFQFKIPLYTTFFSVYKILYTVDILYNGTLNSGPPNSGIKFWSRQ